MKKQAKDLKAGDKVNMFGKVGVVDKHEMSDIGKQGKRKVRLEINLEGERTVIIRPEDYPFDVS